MNFKTTALLLILLLIVGGFFLFVERDAPPREEQDPVAGRAERGTALLAAEQFPKDQPVTVRIRRGDKTVALTREGDNWEQIQPVRFPLNSWSARQLVDEAASLRYTERLKPTEKDAPSLEKAGLSPPEAVVTFEFQGDKPVQRTLTLGRRTMGGRGYLMLDEDATVYITGDGLHRQVLDQKVQDWRRKTLEAPREGQASRVTLARQDQTIGLIKTDSMWVFAPPLSGRVDSAAVGSLLSAISSMYIDKFIDDQPANLAMYGLDNPVLVLTVEQRAATDVEGETTTPPVSSGGPRELRVGGPVDLKREHFFATWAPRDQSTPVVFTIARSDVERFEKQADDLRDPRVTVLKADDVRELSIQRSGQEPLHFLRGTDGWQFVEEGPSYRADSGEVSDLIRAVTDVRAMAYVADYKPAGEPAATLRLEGVGRAEPDVLRLYAAQDQDHVQFTVLRNNETVGYQVAEEKLDKVTAPPLAFRERTVADLPRQHVSRLAIEYPSGEELVIERQVPPPPETQPSDAGAAVPGTPGTWQLQGGGRVESDAAATLLDKLTPLLAESWQVPAAGTASMPIHVKVVAGDQTLSLAVDPATRVARAEGIDAPFLADQDLVDVVQAEFRYRTVLPAARKEIEQVVVMRGEQSITVRRTENDDYVSPDSEVKLDQSAAGGLYDTLAGLRVERFVEPLPLKTEEIAATIQVHTADKQHTLVLSGRPGHENVARLDDVWFTLDEQTLKKLEAELVRP